MTTCVINACMRKTKGKEAMEDILCDRCFVRNMSFRDEKYVFLNKGKWVFTTQNGYLLQNKV